MQELIQKLNAIGIALSTERELPLLLEKILLSAQELTGADGGTLYSVTSHKTLRFEIFKNDSLDLFYGGTSGKAIEFAEIPLFVEGAPNERMVVAHTYHHAEPVHLPDAYDAKGFDFSGTRLFDSKTGYRTQSVLTVPLKSHECEIVAILQLINAKDPVTGAVIPFSSESQELAASLASQAAVAITNQHLISDLQQMLESFLRVIADAIDEKSPVTGRHCKRVPILCGLIARYVNAHQEGVYKNVTLSNSELYELEIAALLHDCGKIVTPVHVVEKATKLQGLYDKIDEIALRLELMRRSGAQGVEEEEAFLRRCNLGGEQMAPEALEHLRALAKREWEYRGELRPLLTEQELKNLSVTKGTLTQEERDIIERHVEVTLRMLDKLRYPKHLQRVPAIAGAHHEKFNGEGYPKRLKGREIPFRARILTIADIFEALTSPDRPYKKPLPLSEALRIMRQKSAEGEIDPDLFELFLKEKVYLEFGKKYLDANQMDVD